MPFEDIIRECRLVGEPQLQEGFSEFGDGLFKPRESKVLVGCPVGEFLVCKLLTASCLARTSW